MNKGGSGWGVGSGKAGMGGREEGDCIGEDWISADWGEGIAGDIFLDY